MERFIGREHELARIRDVLAMPSASVMVYGKRKVGRIGFVSSSGFETTDVPYDLIDGEMLYF